MSEFGDNRETREKALDFARNYIAKVFAMNGLLASVMPAQINHIKNGHYVEVVFSFHKGEMKVFVSSEDLAKVSN